MLLELHILQNFSPSCLNRDDLNAPKDCEFGGVRRARISSQCIKRAARWNPDFVNQLENGIGTRTKYLQSEIVKYLIAAGKDADEAPKVAEPVVSIIGSGVEGEKNRTKVALYLGKDEIERIGDEILAHYDELLAGTLVENEKSDENAKGKAKKGPKGQGTDAVKKLAEQIAKAFKPGTKAADIALFGRMMADATNFNVDAAAQVAHCISTHSVPTEFDFFTAVDDLQHVQPEADAGAGMLGSQQFNSATFYRYANVHLPQLEKNLGGDTDLARKAALAFAHSFITAIPNAKQNSHAALNPADFVFVTLREKGQPLSLANAFAKPVERHSKEGLIYASTQSLATYWDRLTKAYLTDEFVAAPYYTIAPEIGKISLTGATSVGGLRQLLASLSTGLGVEA